jgi:hypothetical protein
MRNFAIAVIMLLLAACVAPSVNPITPLESGVPDNRLFGTWYDPGQPNAVFLHIGANRNGSGLLFVVIDFKEDDKSMDYLACTGYTSRLDGNSYLNVQCDSADEDDHYIFLKYVIENETMLKVFLMDASKIRDAIKSGELKGEVGEPGKIFLPPYITDESQNIAAYIKKHDRELFEEQFPTLYRLQIPSVQHEEKEQEQSAPETE